MSSPSFGDSCKFRDIVRSKASLCSGQEESSAPFTVGRMDAAMMNPRIMPARLGPTSVAS